MFPVMSASARDALLTARAPLIWGSTYWVTSQWLPPDRPLTAAVYPGAAGRAAIAAVGGNGRWPRQWRRVFGLAVLNIAVSGAVVCRRVSPARRVAAILAPRSLAGAGLGLVVGWPAAGGGR